MLRPNSRCVGRHRRDGGEDEQSDGQRDAGADEVTRDVHQGQLAVADIPVGRALPGVRSAPGRDTGRGLNGDVGFPGDPARRCRLCRADLGLRDAHGYSLPPPRSAARCALHQVAYAKRNCREGWDCRPRGSFAHEKCKFNVRWGGSSPMGSPAVKYRTTHVEAADQEEPPTACTPPSTWMISPVVIGKRSLKSATQAFATALASWTSHPSGARPSQVSSKAEKPGIDLAAIVLTGPAATRFTRMPRGPSCLAR